MGSKLVTLKRLAWVNRVGLVRLSENPEDATDPVVVGDNDERLPSEYPTETDENGLAVFGPQRELQQFAQTGLIHTEDGVVESIEPLAGASLLTDDAGAPHLIGVETATATTSLLAPDAVENLAVPFPRISQVLSVGTDFPAWVRVYGSSAARAADAGRALLVKGIYGTGLYVDDITPYLGDGSMTIRHSPVLLFVNEDSPSGQVAYLSVINKDTVDRAITVAIQHLPRIL